MNFKKYDHCGGVAVVPKKQQEEISGAISTCSVMPAKKASSKIGDAIVDKLIQSGWSGEVKLARASGITITSAKDNIGLCLQTGNMSRMYADLIKLQQMFLSGSIKAGIMIVPDHSAAKKLGSNITNSERLIRELDIFRKVIHIPLIIFAFE